jgi:hypothetical protein
MPLAKDTSLSFKRAKLLLNSVYQHQEALLATNCLEVDKNQMAILNMGPFFCQTLFSENAKVRASLCALPDVKNPGLQDLALVACHLLLNEDVKVFFL